MFDAIDIDIFAIFDTDVITRLFMPLRCAARAQDMMKRARAQHSATQYILPLAAALPLAHFMLLRAMPRMMRAYVFDGASATRCRLIISLFFTYATHAEDFFSPPLQYDASLFRFHFFMLLRRRLRHPHQMASSPRTRLPPLSTRRYQYCH